MYRCVALLALALARRREPAVLARDARGSSSGRDAVAGLRTSRSTGVT